VDINKKISSKGGTKRRKRVKNINKSEWNVLFFYNQTNLTINTFANAHTFGVRINTINIC
jgi:hypothetical protein